MLHPASSIIILIQHPYLSLLFIFLTAICDWINIFLNNDKEVVDIDSKHKSHCLRPLFFAQIIFGQNLFIIFTYIRSFLWLNLFL